MKTLATCLTILITLISLVQLKRWADFEREWDNYIRQQTHENAVNVYKRLPDTLLINNFPEERLINKIYENWTQISRKVTLQDKDVIRIGFKLFTIADGAFNEDLGIDLGKLITVNPTLFLQELKNHRHMIQSLDALVCNYGEEYIDKQELQWEETDRRMRLLVNVSDTALAVTKSECLKSLMNKK